MPDEPTPAELHTAGEPHHPEGCLYCFMAAFSGFADALAEGLNKILAALADVSEREHATPSRPVYGPPQRRQRAPRDHPSNTGLAARGRASSQSQRNALRRL